MTRTGRITGLIGATALLAGTAFADPVDDTLVINEEIEMTTRAAAPAHLADTLDEVLSGWHFRNDDTRAMQADDFDNPGMIFVENAMTAWETVEGTEGKSCASCHGDAAESMKGVRAVYPKWNETAAEVRTLEMQVNACRTEQMGAEKWKYGGDEMVNMTALLASVSRGMPINVAIDGPAQATWEMGKEMYYTRYGQLELSCANCH